MILYQLGLSHYCEKVRWALDYKRVSHVKKNLLPGLHASTIRKLTGRTKTPVIQSGSTVVENSADIITWLDQRYPDYSLTPLDHHAADALKWEAFADDEIGDHVRRICYHTLIQHKEIVLRLFSQNGPWYGNLVLPVMYPKMKTLMFKHLKLDDVSTYESIQAIDRALKTLEEHLNGRDYIVDDRFSRADLAVASLLAPLCMPDGYGLRWPQTLPEPLSSTIADLRPRLQWVDLIYQRHRLTRATPDGGN